MKKILKVISFIFILIFSIALFLDVTFLQVISISRSLISENNVSVMIKDFNVVDLLKDENGNYTETGKKVVKILNEEGIPVSLMEEVGDTLIVKNYTKTYVNKLVKNLINNKEIEIISSKEISEFLKSNIDEIVIELKEKDIEDIDYLTDANVDKFVNNIDSIVDKVESVIPDIRNVINDKIKDKLIENNTSLDESLDIIKLIFSNDLNNLLKALFIILITLIIITKHSITRIFKIIGIPFIISGTLLVSIGLLIKTLFENNINSIPYALIDLINNQLGNIKILFINKGIMCLILGLLLILINIIIYMIVSNKKEDKYLEENGL